MRKNIKISLLIILMIFVWANKVNAVDKEIILRDGTKKIVIANSADKKDIPYDITSLNFNMSDAKIHIEGWAYLHGENNWGGQYTIISVGIGLGQDLPTKFQEVNYKKNKDFFGWHCDSGTAECQDWKYHNRGNRALETNEGKLYCFTSGSGYGCLIRHIDFDVDISIPTDQTDIDMYLYLMVSTVDTKPITASDRNNSKLISTAYNQGNEAYNIKKMEKSKIISKYTKIGVDETSCKINGTLNCSTEKDIIASNYAITLGKISNSLTRAVAYDPSNSKTKVYYLNSNNEYNPKLATRVWSGRSMYFNTSTVTEDIISSGIKMSSSIGYWPDYSQQKMYHLENTDKNGNLKNSWVPASWVVPENELKFRFKPAETCIPINENKKLKCENPETEFKIRFSDEGKNCDQHFSTSAGGGGSVKIRFTQNATMKIMLNKTYLKKGEGFTLEARYTDTISWKIVPKTSFQFSTGANQQTVKRALLRQINEFFTQSELMRTDIKHAQFYYKKDYELPGVWSLDKKPSDYVLADPNNTSQTEGSVTVTGKWELYNSWSTTNINKSGVVHEYKPNSEIIDSNKKSNNGKVFYTDLDEKDENLGIFGHLYGLSGLKYQNIEKKVDNPYIWSINYECGITCFQDFYCKEGDCGGTTSSTPKNYSGYKFTYREIDTEDPFPVKVGKTKEEKNIRETRKGIDENWISWANAISKIKKISLQNALDDYIVNDRLAKTYDTKPEYVVEISEKDIDKIKNYNKVNNYYTGVYFDNYLIKSTFLNTMGFTRNVTNLNKVGYCGNSRTKFKDYSEASKYYTLDDILNTNCFCLLTDINGNCIYDSDFQGAGKQ